jgi:hypothetical protein
VAPSGHDPPGDRRAHAGGGLRDLLVATFARVMRLYFREIERLGEPRARGSRLVITSLLWLPPPWSILGAAVAVTSP